MSRVHVPSRRLSRAVFYLLAFVVALWPTRVGAACPELGPYSAAITVQYDGVPLTNYFGILTVDTAAAIGAGHLRADAGDLRFADDSCTEYTYWIESGLNTSTTRIWVVIPSVPTGASGFSAYYGNPALTHTNTVTDVFGPSVAALWTFGEQAGATVRDAFGNTDFTADLGLSWTDGPRPGLGAVTGFTGTNALRAANGGPALGTADFTVLTVADVTPSPEQAYRTYISGWSASAARGWFLGRNGFSVLENTFFGYGSGPGDLVALYGTNLPAGWHMLTGRRGPGQNIAITQDTDTSRSSPYTQAVGSADSVVPLQMGNGDVGNVPGPNPALAPLSLTAIFTSRLDDATIVGLYGSLLPAVHPTLTFDGLITAPTVTSAPLATFTIGAAGTFTVTATGTPPPALAIEGVLPVGMNFDPESRVLSGVPQPGTAGAYPLTIRANNGVEGTQAFTLTVGRIPQSISFVSPGSQVTGASVPLNATATSGLIVALTSTTPAVCTVVESTAAVLAVGTCTIVASQAGNPGTYLPAGDVTQSFDVTEASQTISFVNPGGQIAGQAVALTATATSGLTVTFASATPSVCTVSGAAATLLRNGLCTIVASQAGRPGRYLPAEDVTQSFDVASAAPHAPTVAGVSVLGSLVSLWWTPASTGEPATYYLIEVGDAPGRTTVLTLLTPRLGDTGMLPNGEYYLRVRAVNAAGLSAPSADVFARVTGAIGVPGPPIGLSAQVSGTQVNLAWQRSPLGSAPAQYLLEIGSQRAQRDLGIIPLPSTTTSMQVVNVPPGTYVVRVRATTPTGISPPGPELLLHVGDAATCTQTPTASVMLTPVISGSTVAVTWLEAPGDIPSYLLEAGSAPGQSDLLVANLGGVSGIGATVGDGQYAVRVRPQNSCGAGPVSEERVLTVGGAVPQPPTDLAASVTAGTLTFTWRPPAAGPTATHYVVEAAVGPGAPMIKLPVDATSTLTVPGVPPGRYLVRVRAANASGIGEASDIIVVVVP